MGYTREPILVDIPKQDLDRITNYLLNNWSLLYRTNKDNVEIYCQRCLTKTTISKELFKQAHKSHLCPCCYESVKFHKHTYEIYNKILYAMDYQDGMVGYYIQVTNEFDKEPKVYWEQVAYWYITPKGKRVFMARNIQMDMGGWRYRPDYLLEKYKQRQGFYERKSSSPYCLENQFYWNTDCFRLTAHTIPKKVYYNSLNLVPMKSNQQKMVEENLFNKQQIMAIRIFDLKKPEEVYKYYKWIDKQSFTQYEKRILNVYYLDYLSRNNISYLDFRDYMSQCEELGIKIEKPKDFKKVHEQLSMQLEAKKSKKYDKKIKARYKNLSQKESVLKGLKIKPLESSLEVIEVAHELHNCMASNYMDIYAKGETDLFAVYENDIAIIGIEVLKGRLRQVRAKYNNDPKPKYKKIVKEWYKNAYA